MAKTIKTQNQLLEMIQKFYQSDEYHALQALSNNMTQIDIFGKTRSETLHSAMIAWIMRNDEFNHLPETPVLFLLRLLAKNSSNQEKEESKVYPLIDKDIWEQIILNQLKPCSIEVYTEQYVKNIKPKQSNGRTDIVITFNNCTNKSEKIRIVIENKIDSIEHDEQCKKYFNYYDELNDGYINLYVYLAPNIPDKLSDDHFIKITYQDLLDSVLYPIVQYKKSFSEQSLFYLNEYINTITSIKNNNILAMSKEYIELLKKFYNNNEDLIYAAIEAAAGVEVKEIAEKLRGATKTYTLNLPGKQSRTLNGHSKLAFEIAKYLAGQHDRSTLLHTFGQLDCTGVDKDYIMDHAKTSSAGNKKLYTGTAITCTDGNNVYCNNQWIPAKVDKLIEAIRKYGITVTL